MTSQVTLVGGSYEQLRGWPLASLRGRLATQNWPMDSAICTSHIPSAKTGTGCAKSSWIPRIACCWFFSYCTICENPTNRPGSALFFGVALIETSSINKCISPLIMSCFCSVVSASILTEKLPSEESSFLRDNLVFSVQF